MTGRRRVVGAVAPLFFAALLAGAAGAQPVTNEPATASEAFSAATAAFERRAFAEAARLFETAHRLQPAGAALFNAARAWNAAGDRARAADALVDAIAVGDFAPDERDKAEKLLADLERGLAAVRFEGPTGLDVALPGRPPRSVPFATHVAPGRVEATITGAGGPPRTQLIEVRAGERVRIELASSSTAAAPNAPIAPVSPPVTTPPDAGGPRGTVVAGGVLVGVAGGAAIATAVLGAMSLSARDAFLDSDRYDLDARERASTFRTATNVTWIAGAVVGGTGIVLLVVGATAGDDEPPVVALGLAPGGLGISGSF